MSDWELKDGRLWEIRRETYQGECPECGAALPFAHETEEWVDDGRRCRHEHFGPGVANCDACELHLVDTFEGLHIIPHAELQARR